MTYPWQGNRHEDNAIARLDRQRHAVRAILSNFYRGLICPRVAKRQLAEQGIHSRDDIPRGWLADIAA